MAEAASSAPPAPPPRRLNIVVNGCGHGELDSLYNSVARLEAAHGVVGVLLICGDFQAVRSKADLSTMACPPKYRAMNSFWRYYSGEKVAPVLTIFIGGNHEASNHNLELYYGGWAAPNIYFLGFAGVVSVGGVRIGGLSGIYNRQHYHHGRFEAPPFSDDDMRSVYHVRELEVVRLLAAGRSTSSRRTTGRSTWRATATCRASSAASPSCRASSRAARSARRRRHAAAQAAAVVLVRGAPPRQVRRVVQHDVHRYTVEHDTHLGAPQRPGGAHPRFLPRQVPAQPRLPPAHPGRRRRLAARAQVRRRMDRRAGIDGAALLDAARRRPARRRLARGGVRRAHRFHAHRRRVRRRRGVRGRRPHGARQLCDHGAAAPRGRPARAAALARREPTDRGVRRHLWAPRRLPHPGRPAAARAAAAAAAAAAATAAAAGGPPPPPPGALFGAPPVVLDSEEIELGDD